MNKKKRMKQFMAAADDLHAATLDYCENALLSDRATVDMCNALNRFEKQRDKMVEEK